MAVKLILLALGLSGFLTSCLSVQRSEVTVSPDCSNTSTLPCIELDGAFQNLSSNTLLCLEPGEHVLHMYHGWHLVGLHDVAIIGAKGRESVRITCDDEVGMTFINMSHLVISNIVVDGSGLSNASLRNATDIVKGFLDLSHLIPESIRIGFFLAHCTDLNMSDSVITNTVGLGLLGINIVGNSSLRNVNFTHNIRPRCEKELRSFPFYLEHDEFSIDEIGGGAYFLYQDSLESNVLSIQSSILWISESNFSHNAECSYTGYVNVNYKYFSYNLTYYVGGGGGISIFMPQVTFAVIVNISNSDFTFNDARYGAGAHIGFFARSVSTVWFLSCTFDSNGIPIEQEYHVANGGAGIAVFTDMLQHSHSTNHQPLKCEDDCNNIYFVDTNFARNDAVTEGGGVFAFSLSRNQLIQITPLDFYSTMNFSRCNFESNSAKYGAGLYISQRATQGTEGTWGVNLKDVTVKDNRPPNISTSSIRGQYSAVKFQSILVTITEGSLIIRNNEASGLHLTSSAIYLLNYTQLILQENHAHRGGGAYMEGNIPIIIASKNSAVIFRGNVASAEGGGLYYESKLTEKGILKPLDTVDCFVSSTAAHIGDYGIGMFDSNITVIFEGNKAPIGSLVFGSTLNSCSWAKPFNVSDKDLYLELYYNDSTFKFNEVPYGTNAVSTLPYFISVSEDDEDLSSCPGQVKNIAVSVMDVFMKEIEAVLTSGITDERSGNHNVKLGTSGSWLHRIDRPDIPIHVEGECGDNITVALYTDSNLVSTDISVNILRCFIGFVYNNKTKQCSCDPRIDELRKPSMCNEHHVQLTVPPLMWLGCDSDDCSSTGDLILLECYFSFCNPQGRVFNTSDQSCLCANNSHRSGIMCGGCADGYSMAFGSEACFNCTDVSPAVIVSMSAIGGLASFLFISLLGITIDKGWTYMIIFFCNVVYPYSLYEAVGTDLLKYMLIPPHFFAQEIVVTYCFYDGLDALAKIGFYFLYFAYLYVLMALFTIWCRCSSFASRYFFPPKTLAALIFLTYNLIFKTCVEVLSAVTVSNVAGTNKSLRWLVDPSIPYFQSWHAALGAVSIILVLIYILPFPILLLSPSLAYKYGQRFKPFLDAIWAPFKPKYRIWASLRIAVPVLIIMFSRFISLLAGATANLILLAVFLYVQSTVQPFNDKLINVTDNFLILIVLLMHFGAFRKLSLQFDTAKLSFEESFYVVFLLSLAYVVLVTTFLWYGRNSLLIRGFLKLCSRCIRRRDGYLSLDTQTQQSIQNRPTHTSVSISSEPRRRNFTRIRESLLEDDESMRFVANY